MNIEEVLRLHELFLKNDPEGQQADLLDADLLDADLWGCVGDSSRIKSLFCSDVYPITYTSERLQIGCKNYSFDEWAALSDAEIEEMDDEALGFWRGHKDFIFSTIKSFPAEGVNHEH